LVIAAGGNAEPVEDRFYTVLPQIDSGKNGIRGPLPLCFAKRSSRGTAKFEPRDRHCANWHREEMKLSTEIFRKSFIPKNSLLF